MRLIPAATAAALALAPAAAFAGALSGVSSGLGSASSSSGSSNNNSSSSSSSSSDDSSSSSDEAPADDSDSYASPSVSVSLAEVLHHLHMPWGVQLHGYFGVQKVHDSDLAFTGELAVSNSRARLGVQVTSFSESQGEDMPALTLSIPSFTVGIRVNRGSEAGAYLEAGVVAVTTNNDPNMDTSRTGAMGGLRLEAGLARRTALVGTAQLMIFTDNVRATAAHIGLRVGPLQASLRVVDFNIGPPLWGPEVGLQF